MKFISGNMAALKADSTGETEGKMTKTEAWKKAIEALVDPTSGMDEPERANYEQKIMQKLKSGKRLSSEELDYLRIHNPEMYKIAVRVETERKVLKTKLQNCKSKEEVQQVVSIQMEVLKAMKGDPAQEYMTAMVEKEVRDFKRTSEYARLPQKREKGKKTSGGEELYKETEKMEEGEALCQKAVAYNRMQVQCDKMGELAQTYLSA